MRSHLFALALVVAFATSSACSKLSSVDASNENDIGRSSSPIINGTVDNTHTAVVAIISTSSNQTGLCSGTMIKVDPDNHIGWVLTAAHCVKLAPTVALQSTDFSSASAIRYYVIDYAADPRYQLGGDAGQPYDVAVVRVGGVDTNTPVIPITDVSDGLEVGSPVTAIGFGRTTLLEAGTNTNTERMSAPLVVGDIDSTQIAYDLSTHGICEGDSGGPDLFNQGGENRVVGIHSFIAGDCNGAGVSGRVSGNLDFIQTQLDKPLPERTCQTCSAIVQSGNQECAAITNRCRSNPDCAGFYSCPGATTASGQAACLQEFPQAEGPVVAASECPCNRSCADVCGGTSACADVPACGEALPAGACASCMQSICCQQALDCQADGTCHLCLRNNDQDPSCQSNDARRALATCAINNCNIECSGTEFVRDLGVASPSSPSASGGCAVGQQDARSTRAAGSIFVLLSLVALRRRRRDGSHGRGQTIFTN
ncbi:MAG: S1 family peptidase [Polyangiaceae bacterium]|nr:S1 family peptidase [Polyangiaceae bacterium]